MFRISAGLANRQPSYGRKTRFPKFEFSRQKQANHQVGDGLEVSGSEFRSDWPVGGRAVGCGHLNVCLHFCLHLLRT